MQEMALDPPGSIAELNTRARRWLDLYVDPRPHRVTKEAPRDRLAREVELLGPLPRVRFDTARREPRVVNAPLPLIEVDTVSYSVPPELVGTTVEVRLPVDAGILEIRHRGEGVVTHHLAPPGSPPVWDPAHESNRGHRPGPPPPPPGPPRSRKGSEHRGPLGPRPGRLRRRRGRPLPLRRRVRLHREGSEDSGVFVHPVRSFRTPPGGWVVEGRRAAGGRIPFSPPWESVSGDGSCERRRRSAANLRRPRIGTWPMRAHPARRPARTERCGATCASAISGAGDRRTQRVRSRGDSARRRCRSGLRAALGVLARPGRCPLLGSG
jgi:hypothetical protein